jgi:phosphoglycolate phosphatase-like HAD superfamily hydrolase
MVGDSEDDRKAASEVGCNFVGVNLGKDVRFDSRPKYMINNLTKLKTVIDRHYNDTTNNY